MKYFFSLFLFFVSFLSYSQIRKVRVPQREIKIKPTPVNIDKQALIHTFTKVEVQNRKWYSYNSFGLNMNEMAFSNWNAGGVNSIAILADVKLRRRLVQNRFFWDNELLMNYGINLQEKEKIKKTDDRLVFNSTYGYRAGASDWYYSAKFTFNSQFTNGYKYPNRENPISQLMSPGYFYLGLGAEYSPSKPELMLFLSPLTLKSTVVLNQELADKGSFGVLPAEYDALGVKIKDGQNVNNEVGALISGTLNTKIYDNIMMLNRFSFYSQYNKNFGNIDVDWELDIAMKVNDYIQARLGLHLKYDDDIKIKEGILPNGKKYYYSPKIQLKQLLGIGFSYKF